MLLLLIPLKLRLINYLIHNRRLNFLKNCELSQFNYKMAQNNFSIHSKD